MGQKCRPLFAQRLYVHWCMQMGALSIVDGAHAIGNISNDIEALGADAYVTNLHKWLCTPKGTALLWVAETLQARVRPLVLSHGAGLGFVGEHVWPGTADLAAWLAVPAAVAVHERLGFKAQSKRRQSILEEGIAAMLKRFRYGLPVAAAASLRLHISRRAGHTTACAHASSCMPKQHQCCYSAIFRCAESSGFLNRQTTPC